MKAITAMPAMVIKVAIMANPMGGVLVGKKASVANLNIAVVMPDIVAISAGSFWPEAISMPFWRSVWFD